MSRRRRKRGGRREPSRQTVESAVVEEATSAPALCDCRSCRERRERAMAVVDLEPPPLSWEGMGERVLRKVVVKAKTAAGEPVL